MARIRTMTVLGTLTILAAAAGCGSDDEGTAADSSRTQAASSSPLSPSTSGAPTGDPDEPAANGAPADVSFDDQSGAGDTVTVARISLPTAGFVVITADDDSGDDSDDDSDGRVIGSEALPAGVSNGVTVALDERLTADTDLEAVLYADTDGDGSFDRGTDRRIPDDDDTTVSEDAGYDVR